MTYLSENGIMRSKSNTVQFQIEVKFKKVGPMRFISHLDLVRLFQRAIRRACIPISLSQGFSPHFKISFTRALKLGVESENEEARFLLDRPMDPGQFKEKLSQQLPEGIEIKEAKLSPKPPKVRKRVERLKNQA